MKKIKLEYLIILFNILIFYIIPLFSGPADVMGMIVLMILLTFILSIICAFISKSNIKYLYPIIISILFIPTVYIYYNDSALIHSLWYLVVSIIGLLVGTIIKKIITIIKTDWLNINLFF